MYPHDLDNVPLVPYVYQQDTVFQKSPFIQGFLAGLKGAATGAAGGSILNALQGHHPGVGALIGGLGLGLASGLVKGISQDLDNTKQEAIQRYHAMRLKDNEPSLYLPPPAEFARIFKTFHEDLHRKHTPVVEKEIV